jgi:hypothetical protein
VSPQFRATLVLMALGAYGFGDHVTDPNAFVLRARRVCEARSPISMRQDREVPPCED